MGFPPTIRLRSTMPDIWDTMRSWSTPAPNRFQLLKEFVAEGGNIERECARLTSKGIIPQCNVIPHAQIKENTHRQPLGGVMPLPLSMALHARTIADATENLILMQKESLP